MSQETKTHSSNSVHACQNCTNSFTIEPDDFAFYEKIKVPSPTWCPDCRQQRRYAWRNERTMYRRNCDLCGKSTVTIYSPNKPFKVYCPPCWWGDGWEGKEFGRDFDFSKPFFEQFQALQLEVPRIALLTKNSTASEFTNHSGDNKNCFMDTSCFYSENVLNSNWIMHSRDCADCLYFYTKGERCYQCIDSRNCYHCQFGTLLKDCSDCFYCYDCHGCTDCFLSSNLRNRSYYFLNKPYSKEEYAAKVAEFKLGSHGSRTKLLEQYLDLIQHKTLHRPIIMEQSVQAEGSMIFNCKNIRQCFDADYFEDVAYGVSGIEVKDSMDFYHCGFKTELIYECHAVVRSYMVLFSHLSYDNSHISYCDSCHNDQNLFGCVGLKKTEYCILNKQYSPEEYETLKNKIIEKMKETREYGEFFPVAMSPIGYNETQGQVYMPMTKQEVLAKGWKWEDAVPGTFGKETVTTAGMPDTIDEVTDSIVNEVLACQTCQKNFKIVEPELQFYRREMIPIPRKCLDCRYRLRIALRPPRKLFIRDCPCVSGHFHGDQKCPNEFESSFEPARPETVYCEGCYQSEVV